MKTAIRPFPSHEVFDQAIAVAEANGTLASLGAADLRLGIEVLDDEEKNFFGITFVDDVVTATGPVSEDWYRPEVVLSATAATWEEMVEVISVNGRADLGHTINSLSLANTPVSVRGDDPMGEDKLYRFMGSVQAVFDAIGQKLAV